MWEPRHNMCVLCVCVCECVCFVVLVMLSTHAPWGRDCLFPAGMDLLVNSFQKQALWQVGMGGPLFSTTVKVSGTVRLEEGRFRNLLATPQKCHTSNPPQVLCLKGKTLRLKLYVAGRLFSGPNLSILVRPHFTARGVLVASFHSGLQTVRNLPTYQFGCLDTCARALFESAICEFPIFKFTSNPKKHCFYI